MRASNVDARPRDVGTLLIISAPAKRDARPRSSFPGGDRYGIGRRGSSDRPSCEWRHDSPQGAAHQRLHPHETPEAPAESATHQSGGPFTYLPPLATRPQVAFTLSHSAVRPAAVGLPVIFPIATAESRNDFFISLVTITKPSS